MKMEAGVIAIQLTLGWSVKSRGRDPDFITCIIRIEPRAAESQELAHPDLPSVILFVVH